ncbi:MAG: MFS transporter [Sphingobium sp.]
MSGSANAAGREDRIAGWRLAALAAVAFPIAGAGLPLTVYLPPIYVQEFGLPLATIGAVFLFGRLWDMLSDPLIGSLSDRARPRFGRRRSFIAVGGLLFGAAAALLFFPPGGVVTPLSLGAVLFFFYLGWTMVQVPLLAWSGELSAHYHERTRIVTYQQVVTILAMLVALVLPTVMDQVRPGDGRFKMAIMGGFIMVTLLPALALTLFAVPEPAPPARPPAGLQFGKAVGLILGDRLLLRVLGSDFAVTLAQYVRSTLFVFFVSFYMGLPQWASGLFLFQFVFGVFAGPIWLRIGYRLGKHRAAVLGELSQVAINLGLLLVTPGNLAALIGLTLAQGLAQNSGNLMLRSIVADVADKHRLETGADRAGLFFSVFSLSGKAAIAVAVGVALPLIAWLGFDPKAGAASAGLEGLKWVFALGPALAHALSAALVWGFPLDEARHAEIRRALDEEVDAATLCPAE